MAIEKDRPNKSEPYQAQLWYPDADLTAIKMKTAGRYKYGYPQGAVVHYTSGRSLAGDMDARNAVAWGAKQGYVYFCISRTGKVFQSFPLNEWGPHAGKSAWPGLIGSVSDELVGIEMCSGGLLDENKMSWFGEKYPDEQVRYLKDSRDGLEPAGFYHAFSGQQEASLTRLLMWLKNNNPTVFDYNLVLGHHEVSPGRKQDPGGSLSTSMGHLRSTLLSYDHKD